MTTLANEQRLEVFLRDRYRCVAPRLDPTCGPCRNRWGEAISGTGPMLPDIELTVDHVTPGYGRMGRRADNELGQMVTLCAGHHLVPMPGTGGSVWALAHKDELREYLAHA